MAIPPTEGPADVQIEGGLRFKALDEAPDFTLKDYDDQDLSLSQLRGANVLLQFYNYVSMYVCRQSSSHTSSSEASLTSYSSSWRALRMKHVLQNVLYKATRYMNKTSN